MRRKAVAPAKLKKASPVKLTTVAKDRVLKRRGLPTIEKWRLRWLKFYKFLACVAFCAMVMPYFELLVSVGAGKYATIFTWLSAGLLFAVGYGIHAWIRFLFTKGGVQEEVSFSFETTWQFSSPVVMIPSLILGVGVAVGFSFGAAHILEALLKPNYNAEVGFPLLMIACAVASVLGCLLVPYQFHQLCSLRTLIECMFAFGAPFGIATLWGSGVNPLFALCIVVYALCLFLLMNQEYVIKPSYTSPTCYATRELRLHGMRRAAGLWLITLIFAILILSLLAVLVIPIRFFLTPDVSLMLDFPLKGMPGVNLTLFFMGLLLIPILSVVCIMRFVRPRGLKYWERIIKELWSKITGFFLRLRFRKKSRIEEDLDFKEVVGERPKKQHYVDTVTEASATESPMPTGYRAFAKQLKSLSDINAQFSFAYEVLITELYDAHIGIAKHQTPLEMAAIISRKTSISEMDHLTHTFAAVTYDKGKTATEEDVLTVCRILQARMKA
ncbi:MAG: hypothetical protein E7661_04110 [Ruminococcaceae bacterium]|nr:hypothetical protein [Oscillospiraceae bacterium]